MDERRLHALDILRGLALLGMVLVHFHQKMRIEVTGLEDLIGWAVYLFVEQKSWGTFALLFGVGFAVLIRRLDARGAPVASIYLRRLAALAVFGVIAEVGFGFHILFSYACWGTVLLLVRRWSSRRLLVLAALAAAARPVAAEAVALWSWWLGGSTPSPGHTRELMQAVALASEHGTYLELLAARWALFVVPPASWRALLPDTNLALFLVGLLAVRHRVVDEPLAHVRAIRAWMMFGLASWLMAWTLLPLLPEVGIPGAQWPLEAGLGLIQDQWLCFFYAGAALLLLARHPAWIGRLALVANAGRLALTNYMIQAIVLDALASNYGWDLRIRPLAYLPATLVLFGTIAAFSSVWLSRFRLGPLEWIWRVVTYWQPQPLARA